MKTIATIALILILSSCLMGADKKNIQFDDLFHDRTSKVWIVDQVWINDANISSRSNEEKDVMIFHKNGIVDLIAMKNITRRPPEKGEFKINERLLTIEYRERIDIFEIAHVSEDSILLVPIENSGNQYKIQLKPFKEL